MSPTGPFYAGAAANVTLSGNNWTSLSNATGAPDGNYATAGMPSGGAITDNINLTSFGFAIPSTAIIDGFLVEFERLGSNAQTNQVQMLKAGSLVGTAKNGTDVWPTVTEAFTSYGGTSDLWGATWTPSDINNANFGVQLGASNTHGGGSASLDAVRITVYWHVMPAEVPLRYYYQVYNNGQYLGNLPNVTTPFQFSQDINTAGVQITVNCGVSPDTSILLNAPLLDESGNQITDENGDPIRDESLSLILELGAGSGGKVVRNGNHVICTEVSYWNPNGKVVFQGTIQRIEADFGSDSGSNDVMIVMYSDGADMDNHLVRGNPYTYTTDQSQTSANVRDALIYDARTGWNFDGQTMRTGVGVTNIAAITLLLDGIATVTINFYDSPAMSTLMGSVTQNVNVAGATAVQFNFGAPIIVTASTNYFFTVTVPVGNSIWIWYQNTNVYANGAMYNSNFAGGSGGGSWGVYPPTSDLYFVTYAGTGSTTATYSGVEPVAGMAEPIMNGYIQEGGKVSYTAATMQTTALSISYKFNTNTIYEMLGATLSVCPSGYYYTVDIGTNLLYLRQTNTTADITLIKGFHIMGMRFVATIEQVINAAFLTGAQVSGSNIYTYDSDATSINRYGIHLDRPTNNLVTDTTTGHVIGAAEVKTLKNEQYQTQVTLPYHKIDFSTVKVGMSVGFAGYGNFIDGMVLQIVRVDRAPFQLTLTLGILPKRLHKAVEQTVRGYIGLQTVDNPTSPS